MMRLFKYIIAFALFILSTTVLASPGSLDTTLNGSGIVTTAATDGDNAVYSVIQQQDGKLVAAGDGTDGTRYFFTLVRYNTDGSLDTTFNGSGIVTTAVQHDGWASSVIQQQDGKLVAAGNSYDGTQDFFALVRYNADGSLDTTFNGSGIVTTAVLDGGSYAYSVIQQTDGKLVVAGDSYGGPQDFFALVRYNADGSLDTTFNGSGIVTTAVLDYGWANSVIQQQDGKLVAVGNSYNGTRNFFTLVRYNTDGSLDTTFNGSGIVTTAVLDSGSYAYSVIQQQDGKLVVAGDSYDSTQDFFALVRYNTDGSLDTTFNGSGIVTTAVLDYGWANSVIQQQDGKLVAAGGSYDGTRDFFALVRYNTDGSLDTTFNGNGIVTTAFLNGGLASSVIQQQDGKLVAAGSSNNILYSSFTLVRYQSKNTTPSVKNDYNHDNIAGWIWKGDSNGVETQSEIWQLTYPLYSQNWGIPTRSYPPIFPDQANWEIMTTGDFNADGDADILWRNKTTAAWNVWQMQNGLRVGQTAPADFDAAHAWAVIGAGDTDGDGDDDIILNNASTGEVVIWEMQNYAVVATHSLGTKPGYVVSRIGDFNNDGDVDLLLSQTGGSTLVIWEIQANGFVSEKTFPGLQVGWNLACAGDFDGDGDADILLVNSTTQQERWFEIQNYARVAQHYGSSNTGFVLLGCGDFDGDGDMDMLWQRSADDMNRVVLQQGWGVTKQTVYTNPFGGVNPGAAGYGFKYRNNSN